MVRSAERWIEVLCGQGLRSFAFRSPRHPPVWIEYTNKQKFVNKNSVKGPRLQGGRGKSGKGGPRAFGLEVFLRVKAGKPGKFLHHDAAMIWLRERDRDGD